jgi:hypothetical protein
MCGVTNYDTSTRARARDGEPAVTPDDIRTAEAKIRERLREARRGKHERRALRLAAGGPCRATTKEGAPCRRRGMANGLCGTHGGKDAMQVWLERRGRSRP